jgi:hypothetical protein
MPTECTKCPTGANRSFQEFIADFGDEFLR